MSERRRILLSSIGIMAVVAVSAVTLVTPVHYRADFEEQRARLQQTARSRARIIEAVARFDSRFSQDALPGGPVAATLSQIVEAHENFEGFGETGEFTLARRDGDQIVWLVSHRYQQTEMPNPTPFSSGLAEPMRRALSGESGTLVGLDYRGVRVLAAHEPIAELGWGVVAKIDVAEINRPFVGAGLLAAGIALAVVAAGAALMLRVTSPLIQRIEARTRELREAHDRLEARVAERTAELSDANEQLTREIREREQAQGALQRMSKVFMEAAAPIVIEDLTGRIVDLNAEVERTYGWTRDELLGRPIDTIVPSDWHTQQHELLARCRQGEKLRNIEGFRRTKAGERVPVLLTLSLLTDGQGNPVGVASIAKDLSEQKHLQRQLQAAASEAALAEERERRNLAVDLHDGLGEVLTLASMKLGMLRTSVEPFGLVPQVRDVERLISQAHRRTSSLSFQLSPPVLHDVGLVAAVQWLVEDVEQRFGIHITLEEDGTRQVLDEATRITLFRSLNELLINAVKHARTDKVRVRIWRDDQFIRIAVDDEGVGFDAGADTGGYGLLSVRERFNHLGGSLQISSYPGRGTKIVLGAPVRIDGPETVRGSQ